MPLLQKSNDNTTHNLATRSGSQLYLLLRCASQKDAASIPHAILASKTRCVFLKKRKYIYT